MNKGFVTAMVTIFTVVFIGSGTLYSSLIINDSFEETIEYNTGDAILMSETKLKADLYPKKMRKELNYSINEEMTRDDRRDLTEMSELPIQTHEQNVLERVRTQNRVSDCDSYPSIQNLQISGMEYIISLNSDSVTCEGNSAEANISFGTKELKVDKSGTKYLDMMTDAGELRTNFQTVLPSEPSEFEGDDDGDVCGESRETEKDEAETEAYRNLQSSNLDDLAEEAADETPVTPGITLSQDTEFKETIRTQTSRESCTEIVGCNERRIEGDSTTRCVDPITEPGYKWDVNATLTVQEIQGNFDLQNEDVSLVTGVGEADNPRYRFKIIEEY